MTSCLLLITLILLGFLLWMEERNMEIVSNVEPNEMKQWAVLVASSLGWENYRHQADICQAYHILRSRGLPEEHIVVLMFDDIAYNERNPTPGVIINRPEGQDVYKGVPRDYTGSAVTPETFLSVLKGDTENLKGLGSGKCVMSGPSDSVFVYLADHGGPGVVAFPEDILTADRLSGVLRSMWNNNQYKEILFYLESCESGSMFSDFLPDDLGVLAVTATNTSSPSYACFYDQERETFLADVFSVQWMSDTSNSYIQETVETRSIVLWRLHLLVRLVYMEILGWRKSCWSNSREVGRM